MLAAVIFTPAVPFTHSFLPRRGCQREVLCIGNGLAACRSRSSRSLQLRIQAGVVDPRDAEKEQFFRVLALHKYFLNADFVRDVFMRRINQEQSPAEVDFATSMDDSTTLSLWYATSTL